MTRELLEIVELPDGKIILRRGEGEDPIVTLTFSRQARAYLKGRYIDVAKSMFHAGLQTAGQLHDEQEELDALDSLDPASHTMH